MRFQKGRIVSDETRKKISLAHTGKKISDETRQKLILARKGKKPMLGKHHSEETKLKIGLKSIGRKPMLGKKHSIKSRKKMSLSRQGENNHFYGKHHTEETKLKIKLHHLGKYRGKDNPNWRGGITPINLRLRTSPEYKLWRKSVFERDSYTCVWCGLKNGLGKTVILHADHIKPFYLFPELRFAIDNGRTLCVNCHRKTNTYGGQKSNC